MKLWKKIVIILVVAVLAIGIAVCCGIYAYNESFKPEIKEENLAADVICTEKSLLSGSPLSFWKASSGEFAEIDLGDEKTFNTIVLEEHGDNVKLFRFYKYNDGVWELFYEQDRIAGYRMCTFESVTASKIKIEVIAQESKTVKLNSLEIYNRAKSENEIRVSQYLTFGADEIVNLRNAKDEGFSGYYDVVTDVIVIGEVGMDDNANITFGNGEEAFAANMQALKEIIGDRDVKIWTTVNFTPPKDGEERDETFARTTNFVNENIADITKNINTFVEKYGVYGVDYDWEYPANGKEWKAYNKIVVDSAKLFPVSVALPPWGIKFSDDAIKSIELINVMAYDLFDDRGDHANIQWGTVLSAKRLKQAGFDDKQILIGIPTYGRTTDASAYAWPVARGSEDILGKYNSIVKDYEYTDENGKVVKCDGYVQSYAEARDKTAYAEAMGIGGVMIFRAKCDSPYTYEYSIHRAIKEAIDN